jgi:O-antigen/teichoic acid export membrane protein
MKALFHRVVKSAVAWAFLNTLLRVGMSIFVLPLILRKMPSEQLGLWYVFGTIGGLASLLDLGFEPTITRMASYAWSGASRFIAFGVHKEEEESQAGNGPNRLLLSDLVATLRAYYFWVGVAILLLLSFGGGVWVWKMTATLPSSANMRMAWLVYAAGCSLNFITGRWPALVTGLGAVKEGQRMSLLCFLVYYVLAVGGLMTGFGIWALVLGFLGMGFVARTVGKRIFLNISALPGGLPAGRLHREIFAAIWPNAWRMGLVSLGSFMITRSNTLICSAFLGLQTTASYGISLQLMATLVGVSSIWVTVRMPQINQLRVKGLNNDIATIFASRMRLTLLCYVAGALVTLFFGPVILKLIGSKTTLISPGLFAVLAFIQLLEMHHSLYAGLVLSENRNPFLKQTLISGALIVIAGVVLTPRYGLWGMVLSTGIVQACYNNWWPVKRAVTGLEMDFGHYLRYFFLSVSPWKKP